MKTEILKMKKAGEIVEVNVLIPETQAEVLKLLPARELLEIAARRCRELARKLARNEGKPVKEKKYVRIALLSPATKKALQEAGLI